LGLRATLADETAFAGRRDGDGKGSPYRIDARLRNAEMFAAAVIKIADARYRLKTGFNRRG